MSAITAYKIDSVHLNARLAELQKQVGNKPLLPIFVEQTRKVIARDTKNYLRYGPYWWAIKRILRNGGVNVGSYDEPMWANEYEVRNDDGTVNPELTLLAAWEFGDDNIGRFGVQTNEYDLDGITFLLFDPDQNARGK